MLDCATSIDCPMIKIELRQTQSQLGKIHTQVAILILKQSAPVLLIHSPTMLIQSC